MNLQLQQVPDTTTQRNFERLREELLQVPSVVRTLVDATAGAVIKYLPDGATTPPKDYYFQKVDSSGNSVTITPAGAQTIVGAATKVLAAQYDRAYLIWSPATQEWVIL